MHIGISDRKPPGIYPADKGVIYHRLSWSIKTFIYITTESAAARNNVEHVENKNTTSRIVKSVESLGHSLDVEGK